MTKSKRIGKTRQEDLEEESPHQKRTQQPLYDKLKSPDGCVAHNLDSIADNYNFRVIIVSKSVT
jgi:hypothetical protein